MRELNIMEMQAVAAAGDLTFEQRFEGAVWGIFDALSTGVAVAGKVSGAGGLVVGGINQAVSAVIGAVCGVMFGAVGGFMVGRDAIAELCHDYRFTFGGASQSFGSI
ncbi:hypothetical protein JTF19_14770 [Enterobacteriaceae bacterium RIT814]|uniref:DUF5862 family protein n=1 Tax=Leclercia pneumoniae TaxID=2815358 RepID=UPI002DBDC616|nr:hypothetical protein [Leclercia pneumoniae]MBM6607428.1 hypothetical protein [Enterobacteriaceae bacterium RIT 814]MEB7501087.1 hypothetical protein [Leclercia pneumoniae]